MSRRRAALAVTAAVLTGVLVSVPPAHAADNDCLTADDRATGTDTARISEPYEALGIGQAQTLVERSAAGGDPVRVALLASLVRTTDDRIPVADSVDLRRGAAVQDEDADQLGTVVAGLVAGADRSEDRPVGFAPRAEVVAVRVFTDRLGENGAGGPTSAELAEGLAWVASHAGELNLRVAVVPFVVRRTSALAQAVRDVRRAGIVLVAAVGDRDQAAAALGDQVSAEPDKREDGAGLVYPASYRGVVAVSASGPDAVSSVLPNSRTTLAAPTLGAVSYGINGSTCVVSQISSGLAAAEVAGVAALLWQRFPDATRAQIVARLVNTASGTTGTPTTLTGAGIVQPVEALTRPLSPTAGGQVDHLATEAGPEAPVRPPAESTDLLARTRDDAVWWGLIGGGLLVVALLLRPVLARRRT